MDIGLSDVIEFIVTYKWWLIACAPILIVIMALRARG